MGTTVATTSSRALLAACSRLSLDTASLLANAGLTQAQLDDPDGRLPGEAVAKLWQGALQQSRDPDLGLRVALAVPFGAYRVIDFLAASAPTVGEGLTRVARYFPLINSSLQWTISDEREHVHLALETGRELPRPYCEYALTVTILHCRQASGFPWPLEEVHFSFPAPASPAEHARVFGCSVHFGSGRSGFSLSHATWALPSQAASSELLRTLEAHADRLIAALSTDAESQVARLLIEELRGGEPSLPKIAKKLAVSPRTLQRRLEEERTSFADVLDATRRQLAKTYLEERALALAEIAYLLGFSEQSAFTRAFNRWYGVPPSQFRARAS